MWQSYGTSHGCDSCSWFASERSCDVSYHGGIMVVEAPEWLMVGQAILYCVGGVQTLSSAVLLISWLFSPSAPVFCTLTVSSINLSHSFHSEIATISSAVFFLSHKILLVAYQKVSDLLHYFFPHNKDFAKIWILEEQFSKVIFPDPSISHVKYIAQIEIISRTYGLRVWPLMHALFRL